MINDVTGAVLDRLIAVHTVATQMEASIVNFKSAIEAGSGAVQRVENQRADKSSGVIALSAQYIGQVWKTRRKRNAKVVDAIELGIRPGEDSRMRCSRDRNMSVGAGESYALAGHRVEVRSEAALGAEEAHAI